MCCIAGARVRLALLRGCSIRHAKPSTLVGAPSGGRRFWKPVECVSVWFSIGALLLLSGLPGPDPFLRVSSLGPRVFISQESLRRLPCLLSRLCPPPPLSQVPSVANSASSSSPVVVQVLTPPGSRSQKNPRWCKVWAHRGAIDRCFVHRLDRWPSGSLG